MKNNRTPQQTRGNIRVLKRKAKAGENSWGGKKENKGEGGAQTKKRTN